MQSKGYRDHFKSRKFVVRQIAYKNDNRLNFKTPLSKKLLQDKLHSLSATFMILL